MAQQIEGNKRSREEVENEIKSLEPEGRSPKQKRLRHTENMIKWDVLSDENELIMVTMVINLLEEKTKIEHVKKLIDCYNPIMREETDMIKNYILQCCKQWDNKEDKLRETIRYVWPENGLNLDNIMEVEKLAEFLIMSIEILMPKMCKECDSYYMVGSKCNPTVRCMWCKVGAHDCIDRGNKQKLKGMMWMCKICNEIMEKQILPKIDLVKKMELIRNQTTINFKGFEKKDDKRPVDIDLEIITNAENNEENNSSSDTESISNIENSNDRGSNGSDSSGNDNDRNNNGNGRSSSGNSSGEGNRGGNIFGGASSNINDNNNNRRICWHFMNHSCKFGNNCRNIHPEICKAWSEYGQCRNSRCRLAHPKRCRIYDDQGECHKANCWYIHPTKKSTRDQRTYQRTIKQHQNQGFRNNQDRVHFLENWPKPAEASMNINQTLARLIGTMEKVNARVENIERNQINRW